MARRAGGTLNPDAADTQRLRGDGFIAWVDPAWRAALDEAGWLVRDPLRGRAINAARTAGAGRGTVHRVSLGPGPILVRPLRRGGWLRALLDDRFLRARRPIEEARVTSGLRARGAPVPGVVLALAWRRGGFWRGLVATREIGEVDNGFGLLACGHEAPQLRRALAAVGVALRRFHDAGGSHRDLNLGNLLISRNPESPRAWVIDLDGARLCRRVSPRRRMRELMRLYRSLRKSGAEPSRAIALRVFHSYCGGDRALRAELLRWRRLEAGRVAIHALRYGE